MGSEAGFYGLPFLSPNEQHQSTEGWEITNMVSSCDYNYNNYYY